MRAKRIFDFIFALLGIVVCSPLIVVISILILIDSKGPPIFKQTRVGKDNTLFTCYKLRTMYINSPNVPTDKANISSISRIGKILRMYKVDELPQLYNVLRGEMSLVGPRPCLPQQVELINFRTQNGVSTLLPGITGLSQVNGYDMSQPKKLANSDLNYKENMNLSLDIDLIIKTIFRGWELRQDI